ncbi:MAG: 3-hydroxyacyl-CoA dehydrogenase family protein [Sulfobacillus sp.]
MLEPVLVVGQDALAAALRETARHTAKPLTLVTDPALLPEALQRDGRMLAVTAWSAGGEKLGQELGLSVQMASFGSVLPLSATGPTDVSLPPALDEASRRLWKETLTEALGDLVEVEEGPGLVRPRMVATLINEAAHLFGERLAAAEEIDRAMVLGMNHPRGPLAWADEIGLDVVERLLLALSQAYGAEIYRPAPALVRLVRTGHTGMSAGRGFFNYVR